MDRAPTDDASQGDEAAGIRALPSVGAGVALWWCDLQQRAMQIAECAAWLSPGEQARAGRLGNEQLRARYVAGRTALRYLLGRALSIAPGAVTLRQGRRGRPELAGERMPDFNVSHTQDAALIGIVRSESGSSRIGVDLERADRTVGADRLARKFLTASERESQAGRPANERVRLFLDFWTCKEAMSKATGDGLSAPFGALNVMLGDPPRLIAGPPPYLPPAWQLQKVSVPEGYLGIVAMWTPGGA